MSDKIQVGNKLLSNNEQPGRYVKKPLVIDAIQWTKWNPVEVTEFCKEAGACSNPTISKWGFEIDTHDGPLLARIGDWIIKGVKGELYTCRDDVFKATYEAVKE